jgi:hypothetical protein
MVPTRQWSPVLQTRLLHEAATTLPISGTQEKAVSAWVWSGRLRKTQPRAPWGQRAGPEKPSEEDGRLGKCTLNCTEL